MGLSDAVGHGGGCGVREVVFEGGPHAFDGVVLGAVFRAGDQEQAWVVGEPSAGDATVVSGAVVADHGHDRGVGTSVYKFKRGTQSPNKS